MTRLVSLAAVLVVAAPAFAQGNSAPNPVEVIDPALVGDWTLMKVEALGEMGRYGAEIQEMQCAFNADGTAEVRLSIEQDEDVTSRTRAFEYVTDDGRIASKGMEGMAYQVFGGDLLVLRSEDGLVVHLRRLRAGG